MHYGHGCWTLQVSLVNHLCLHILDFTVLLYQLALMKKFDGQADNLIVGYYSLFFICHLPSLLIWSISNIKRRMYCIEIPPSFHFIFEKPRYQPVNNVLKGLVRPNIQKGFRFVNLDITNWTEFDECKHSTMVVASIKYPPHKTHIKCGFSSVILIFVVLCIVLKIVKS